MKINKRKSMILGFTVSSLSLMFLFQNCSSQTQFTHSGLGATSQSIDQVSLDPINDVQDVAIEQDASVIAAKPSQCPAVWNNLKLAGEYKPPGADLLNCQYEGSITTKECVQVGALPTKGELGLLCQQFLDPSRKVVFTALRSDTVCPSTWHGFKFISGFNRVESNYYVCQYEGSLSSKSCAEKGSMLTAGSHGTWCQEFTDKTNKVLLSHPRLN